MLLSGEPGIGKSRLTAALFERVASEPHTRLRYFCSPQRTDSTLFPIIGQMERAAFRSFIYMATLRFSPMLGLEPVSAAAAIFR